MNIALTHDFDLKFDVRDIRWKYSGVATIGGRIVGLWGEFRLSFYLLRLSLSDS
jgi:hypothetical protein